MPYVRLTRFSLQLYVRCLVIAITCPTMQY